MTVIYKVIKLYIKCNSLGVMDIIIIKFTCISSFKCLKGTSTLQANISQKGKCIKLKIFGTKNCSSNLVSSFSAFTASLNFLCLPSCWVPKALWVNDMQWLLGLCHDPMNKAICTSIRYDSWKEWPSKCSKSHIINCCHLGS